MNHRKLFYSFFLFWLAGNAAARHSTHPPATIVGLAEDTPDLSTLVTALKAADLVDTLSGEGPFTVFAPTNEAFNQLPAGTLAHLLKPANKAQLVDILTYHVLSGAVHAADISNGERLKTVEGKYVTFTVNHTGVFVNNAQVTTADINASNGVVHIINAVLIPPRTIVELAEDTPDLSTLVTALKAADLVDTLSGDGPFTVFAPTNEAFNQLPAGTLAYLLNPANKAKLVDILTYHVVSGAVLAGDLIDGERLKTVEGEYVTFSVNDTGVFVNTAQVTTADIHASNGVVHIINEILLPPSKPVPVPTILEIVNSDPDLIFFSTLLKSAGLTQTLDGHGPFTVLAPTNAAFDTFNVNDLIDPANSTRLGKILKFHVIPESLYPSNVTAGLVDSLDGDSLQVIVITDRNGDWQLTGKYIGAPRAYRLNISHSFKIQGWHSGKYAIASNGIVYFVGGVLTPPNTTTVPRIPKPHGAFSGCTKDSCVFQLAIQPGGPGTPACCGQVDASSRLPPSIFNDTVALQEYIRITEQLSAVLRGGTLINQACPQYSPNGSKTIDWFEGFKPWCQIRCGCGLLKPCTDLPDDPDKHVYCSLCGPKYNAPMEVKLYHLFNNPTDCSSLGW